MSDESERVRRIREQRENIIRKGAAERESAESRFREKHPEHVEAVVTVSKTDRFKAGLSRIKEGASRVGHEAKEQVSNPESGTRKAASEFKRGGQAVVGGARKVANTETFKRVSANSVDLVRGNDNGLLGIHAEQRSRSKNSHMSGMFNQEIGVPIHPLAGIGNGVGGNFSVFGEGKRTAQPHVSGKSKRRKEVVTINGKTYSRKVRNRKHRSKRKRKPVQSTWSLF